LQVFSFWRVPSQILLNFIFTTTIGLDGAIKKSVPPSANTIIGMPCFCYWRYFRIS